MIEAEVTGEEDPGEEGNRLYNQEEEVLVEVLVLDKVHKAGTGIMSKKEILELKIFHFRG